MTSFVDKLVLYLNNLNLDCENFDIEYIKDCNINYRNTMMNDAH